MKKNYIIPVTRIQDTNLLVSVIECSGEPVTEKSKGGTKFYSKDFSNFNDEDDSDNFWSSN